MPLPRFIVGTQAGTVAVGAASSCADGFASPEVCAVVPQLSIPVYGNHCGPGYGDPNKPAVDAVDAVCKAHDACYSARGYFDCRCDRELIRSMPAAIAAT